jgi:hypothetical protein
LLAALGACVVADAKEVRKWNDWSSLALDSLIDEGAVVFVDPAARYVVTSGLSSDP